MKVDKELEQFFDDFELDSNNFKLLIDDLKLLVDNYTGKDIIIKNPDLKSNKVIEINKVKKLDNNLF